MQKKMFILIVAVIIVFILGSGYLKHENRPKKDIVILEKESYLSDFIVEGDVVQISCVISIENRNDVDKTIRIVGDFKNEINTGLLKERKLQGVFTDENSNEITIASNSTQKNRSVVFYGEYGGVKKMKNRNLPDIEIIELSEG